MKYNGNNEKQQRIVIPIPANNDDEDFDDLQVGHYRLIGQDKKLLMRDSRY